MGYTASAFTAGSTLTAAQMEVLRDSTNNGHCVFTNEAARDAAITSPTKGMMAYLTAPTVPAATGSTTTSVPAGVMTIYNGTVWVCTTAVAASSSATSNTFGTGWADLTVGGVKTSVTLVTGTTAMISYAARIAGSGNYAQIGVKSATVAANNDWAATAQVSAYVTVGRTFVMYGLTAGTNTFTMQCQNNVAGATADQISLTAVGIA